MSAEIASPQGGQVEIEADASFLQVDRKLCGKVDGEDHEEKFWAQ